MKLSIVSLFGFFSITTGKYTQTKIEVNAQSICTTCTANVCSIIPPANSTGYPCYQGNNKDTQQCYNTDPLLAPGSTWACGECVNFGFPTYLRNDPIYVNMELWSQK